MKYWMLPILMAVLCVMFGGAQMADPQVFPRTQIVDASGNIINSFGSGSSTPIPFATNGAGQIIAYPGLTPLPISGAPTPIAFATNGVGQLLAYPAITPWPVACPTPTGCAVAPPTIAPGLAQPVVIVCPSTAPAVINGAYTCTNNSSGQFSVNIVAQASPISVVTPPPFGPWSSISTPNPTSSPTSVKGSSGTLYGAQMWNGSGSTLYIGFYNAATASVTLGSTVPLKVLACTATTYCFLPIPAGGSSFGTAITYLCGSAMTGGVPTTACGSNTTTFLSIDYLTIPIGLWSSNLAQVFRWP